MRYLHFLTFAFLLSIFTQSGFSNSSQGPVVDNAAPAVADSTCRLLPPKNKRDSDNLTLAKYLLLKDNQYILDITEQDALKLGVNAENYRKSVREIDEVNKFIKQRLAAGEKIDFIDFQKFNWNRKETTEIKRINP